jgi:hypothetical protein
MKEEEEGERGECAVGFVQRVKKANKCKRNDE